MHTRAPTKKGRRRAALTAIGALAVATLTLIAPAASAAAPDNDSWEQATEVTALPFEDSVDTTDATTDPVNPAEIYRYRRHSIWYHVNLPADTTALFSALGTNYSFKMLLYQADSASQSPDEWTKVRGGRRAGFVHELQADTDYFVVLGAARGSGGGLARLVMRAPAHIEVMVNDPASYDPVDGSALLEGTITSDHPTEVYLSIGLRQLVGERVVEAFENKHMKLSTDPTPWQMRMSGKYGFKPGLARVIAQRLIAYDAGVRIRTVYLDRDTVTLQ